MPFARADPDAAPAAPACALPALVRHHRPPVALPHCGGRLAPLRPSPAPVDGRLPVDEPPRVTPCAERRRHGTSPAKTPAMTGTTPTSTNAGRKHSVSG